ncbi:putative membrane protein [Sulfurospirillum diekertiae]|jgi:F0F1-type ATP synthase assembly protein I|uniref:Membrane protein n=1 Tax=Sulfurospirillum diekertiae TaxID=1854492 RepID=A0A290HUB8_9BACT|nr:AtpZ/AtpI family protein [Sulfurospirillum diekertiae]ATB69250.1 putative membrane protein [Sulfurospirillum diekertiae]
MSEKPKYGKLIEGAEQLSLGISIVVAVLIGIGVGMLMSNVFNTPWLLWVGVFWGVGGAILNVYKAYKKNVASLDELKDDVRYKKYQQTKDDDEDDDDK